MLKLRAIQQLFEENRKVVDLYHHKEKLKEQNRKERFRQANTEFKALKYQFVKKLKILDQLELVKLFVGLATFLRSNGIQPFGLKNLELNAENIENLDSFKMDQLLIKEIYDSGWLVENDTEEFSVFKPSFTESITNAFSDKNRLILNFLNILNTVQVSDLLNAELANNNVTSTLGNHTLPFLKNNQNLIVDRVITGISRLLEMRTRVSEDFTNGMLTTRHYNFLFEKIDTIIGKLRKTLAHRLNQVIKTKNVNHETYEKLVNIYFTSDYLNANEYELLMKNFE